MTRIHTLKNHHPTTCLLGPPLRPPLSLPTTPHPSWLQPLRFNRWAIAPAFCTALLRPPRAIGVQLCILYVASHCDGHPPPIWKTLPISLHHHTSFLKCLQRTIPLMSISRTSHQLKLFGKKSVSSIYISVISKVELTQLIPSLLIISEVDSDKWRYHTGCPMLSLR